MTLLGTILATIGIAAGAILAVYIAIQAFLLYLTYKLISKHPALSLFLLIVIIAIAVVGSLDPATVIPAVATGVTAVLMLVTQYKKLKRGLRLR